MRRMIILTFLILINLRLTAPEVKELVILETPFAMEQLNWRNIRYEISRNDIQYPDILLKKIRHETGNLSSRLCRECNNLTGMHYPVIRETTAIGRVFRNNAAIYDTWQDCIKDYELWQSYFYKGGDYYAFLDGLYATDPHYIDKLIAMK